MFENLALLVILLIVIGAGVFSRGSGSKSITHLLIWVFVILALVVGYGQYEKLRFKPRQVDGVYEVTLPIHRFYGGYVIKVAFNGVEHESLIDTGATNIVLTYEDAKAAGIAVEGLSFNQPVSTANGTTYVADAMLDTISVGDAVTYSDVRVSVSGQGDLDMSLLGIDFLQRTKGYEVSNNVMKIGF